VFEFSRGLAYVFGIALPVLETIRRWSQLGDLAVWPFWLDDLLLGAVLLIAARLTADHSYSNAKYLAAAWGIVCGMAWPSFFGEILHLDTPDPAPIPTGWVAAIKGIGFLLAIVALIGALKPPALSPLVGAAAAPLASMPPAAGEALALNPDRLEQMLDPTDDA
jgi:hypothetical protein